MEDKELMSKEAFIELIDNLEIVKELSSYGVKNIKYYFKKLQEENESLKEKIKNLKDIEKIMNTDVKELAELKNIEKIKSENWILQEEKEKYKYLYQKALDNTIISDRENIRLKKQIDLMAKYIAKTNKTKKFCDVKYICDQNCESCIIQYFKDEVGE